MRRKKRAEAKASVPKYTKQRGENRC